MERRTDEVVATFFWPDPVEVDAVPLRDGALQHALVRRLSIGDAIRLVSGDGRAASGRVAEASRSRVVVAVESVETVPGPVPLAVFAPIGDRDRMLWAAEKCAEHAVTSWTPVFAARSRSVAGRGEGPRFAEKVAARMRSALEQSGGAWLPVVHDDVPFLEAVTAPLSGHVRVLLDPDGAPLAGMELAGAFAVAAGPEGGLQRDEIDAAVGQGWRLASLGSSVLRFETAIVSAVAVIRAAQHSKRSN